MRTVANTPPTLPRISSARTSSIDAVFQERRRRRKLWWIQVLAECDSREGVGSCLERTGTVKGMVDVVKGSSMVRVTSALLSAPANEIGGIRLKLLSTTPGFPLCTHFVG